MSIANSEPAADGRRRRVLALALATVALAICQMVLKSSSIFSSPMEKELVLSDPSPYFAIFAPLFISVASTVSGAFACLLFGILSDRLGARHVLTLLMVLAGAGLLGMTFVRSLEQFLVASIILNVSSAAQPVVAAYVCPFYSPHHRGTALGILFGAAVIERFLLGVAFRIGINKSGAPLPTAADALALFIMTMAVTFWVLSSFVRRPLRKHRREQDDTTRLPRRTRSPRAGFRQGTHSERHPFKRVRLWRFSLYYFYLLGGLGISLEAIPVYLSKHAELGISTIVLVPAGLVISAGFCWIVGGFLSDKVGAHRVLHVIFPLSIAAALALSALAQTQIAVSGSITGISVFVFIGIVAVIIAALTIGAAAVFNLIAAWYPKRFGTAAGLVSMMPMLGSVVLGLALGSAANLTNLFLLQSAIGGLCMLVLYVSESDSEPHHETADEISRIFS